MTGDEVRDIRIRLGQALGRKVSYSDLGTIMGLSDRSGHDTVRSWEDGSKDISGPATLVLELLDRAMDRLEDGTFAEVMLDTASNRLGPEPRLTRARHPG